MTAIRDLDTMAKLSQTRRAVPKYQMVTRDDERATAKKAADDAEAIFIADVRAFAKRTCLACHRKVKVTLERVPNRCEIHHLHGRIGVLRFMARAAICVCHSCHRKLTTHRLIPIGSAFFMVSTKQCIDGRAPITFKEAA